jgi:hypothetical protein
MALCTGEGMRGVEDGESCVVLGLPTLVSGVWSFMLSGGNFHLKHIPLYYMW